MGMVRMANGIREIRRWDQRQKRKDGLWFRHAEGLALDRQEEASVCLLIGPTRWHLGKDAPAFQSGPLTLYPNRFHNPVGPQVHFRPKPAQ